MIIDLEIALIKAFHWLPRDIDKTNIETLLPILARLPESLSGEPPEDEPRQLYADQVGWLK